MNLDEIDKKLNKISAKSKKLDEDYIKMIDNIALNDDTNSTYEYFPEKDKHYLMINNLYKKYISQYSKSYIEMSEYYYGEELPYDIYCREFKKDQPSTYLDSPKDVIELYKLFIYYGMLERFFKSS